jgi:hypothetical protein
MIVLRATVSAIVPSLRLLWYLHSRDTFREPPRVVWTTFALGALSIARALYRQFGALMRSPLLAVDAAERQ